MSTIADIVDMNGNYELALKLGASTIFAQSFLDTSYIISNDIISQYEGCDGACKISRDDLREVNREIDDRDDDREPSSYEIHGMIDDEDKRLMYNTDSISPISNSSINVFITVYQSKTESKYKIRSTIRDIIRLAITRKERFQIYQFKLLDDGTTSPPSFTRDGIFEEIKSLLYSRRNEYMSNLLSSNFDKLFSDFEPIIDSSYVVKNTNELLVISSPEINNYIVNECEGNLIIDDFLQFTLNRIQYNIFIDYPLRAISSNDIFNDRHPSNIVSFVKENDLDISLGELGFLSYNGEYFRNKCHDKSIESELCPKFEYYVYNGNGDFVFITDEVRSGYISRYVELPEIKSLKFPID